MDTSAAGPLTPCVNICVMDPRSNLCIGCGRTLDEIARWGAFGEAERHAIMGELESRLIEARSRRARRRPAGET